jgi:Uma2 family endonuclease
MALTVGERTVHPLTADDVMRMVEVGILDEGDRVELLDGVLTEVSPKSADHGTVIARLVRWLVAADPAERYEVRTEHPFLVPDRRSLPEPDVAVIERGASGGHPATALLVIEVAVTSLRTDTQVKPGLYAAAGVPEYWVVDVPGRRVERFTEPGTGGFGSRRTRVPPEVLSPVAFDVAPLALDGLFAGVGRA